MDTGLRLEAETAARLLLQEFRADHPEWTDDKTPVDEIAAWLQIYVATFDASAQPLGTYGYVDPDDDEQLIWLFRDLKPSLRRFTLAHELGHVVLHCHDGQRYFELLQRHQVVQNTPFLTQTFHLPQLSSNDTCQDADLQEGITGYLEQEQAINSLGSGFFYDPRSQREQAANAFAAELLIPQARLLHLYLTEKVSPLDLANLFGVSHAALLNRLASLVQYMQQDGFMTKPLTVQNTTTGNSNQATGEALAQKPKTESRKSYDDFQQAAIEAPTPALIVAGPGSGKTSTLIGRIEYLIQVQQIDPRNILALTFSRKATQEMEERLKAILSDNGQELPVVSTFHAFCADLLRQHGKLIGLRSDFTLIDNAEGYFLLRSLARKMRLRHYQMLHNPAHYFPDMLKAISRAKDELITPDDYMNLALRMREQAQECQDTEAIQRAEKAIEVAHIYALYEEELQRRGDSDFGGLLTLTLRLFQEQPDLLFSQQQKYQHILVDEFQDMNRASGVLLRELAGSERNVWVVGDANQAIYGFRGASPANINLFAKDFPGATILPLSRNYRSRPDLVAIAESFRCRQLEPGEEPGKNQPVRLTSPDTYVTLAQASDDSSEIAGMIEDIKYKRSNGYTYNDMMILCRTRAHAQKISRALAQVQIPVTEQSSLLEQPAIKDVLSVLLLICDKSGMGLLRLARQPEHPMSQQDIELLLLEARKPEMTPRQLILNQEVPFAMSPEGQRTVLYFSELLKRLVHNTDVWSVLAQYLFLETDRMRNLLAHQGSSQGLLEPEKQKLLADYSHLLQLARQFDQQQERQLALMPSQNGQDEARSESETGNLSLEERIKGFLEYLALLVQLRQDSNQQEKPEESLLETERLRVMTVHASKGLEFPVVYLPGLVQRRFPLQPQYNAVNPPAGMLAADNEGLTAHESGESCLFYVGVTRARDQLILSYSERYGKQNYKRSPYLDALIADLPEERVIRVQWDQPLTEQDDKLEDDAVIDESQASQPDEDFINAMRPPTLSTAAIEAYQRCPRQYAYDTIYHFGWKDSAYQMFWSASQKTLEELHRRQQDQVERIIESEDESVELKAHDLSNHSLTQAELYALYQNHWQASGGHLTHFAPLYEEHGQEIINTIQTHLPDPEHTTWKLRTAYNVDFEGTPVRTVVDREETSKLKKQPARFVRMRYGGKPKEKITPETRELFYQIAYRQMYPGQTPEIHSHNLSTGEILPVKLTTKKEQSLYEAAKKAIEGLQENRYPAQPAQPFQCPSCPFFMICPA